MTMIAFAAFIVIPQNTFPLDHQRQPIFERVKTSGNRLRQMPQDDLEEGRLVNHLTCLLEQYGLHVVILDNISVCCQ